MLKRCRERQGVVPLAFKTIESKRKREKEREAARVQLKRERALKREVLPHELEEGIS